MSDDQATEVDAGRVARAFIEATEPFIQGASASSPQRWIATLKRLNSATASLIRC